MLVRKKSSVWRLTARRLQAGKGSRGMTPADGRDTEISQARSQTGSAHLTAHGCQNHSVSQDRREQLQPKRGKGFALRPVRQAAAREDQSPVVDGRGIETNRAPGLTADRDILP